MAFIVLRTRIDTYMAWETDFKGEKIDLDAFLQMPEHVVEFKLNSFRKARGA